MASILLRWESAEMDAALAVNPRSKEIAMRAWQVGILIALLGESVAFAGTDQREGDVGAPALASGSPQPLLRQALALGADAAEEDTQVSGPPAGIGDWQRRIDDARSRQNSARIVQLSGVGVGIATTVVSSVMIARMVNCSTAAFSSGPESVNLSNCAKPGNLIMAVGIGGALSAALTAVGCGERRSAHHDLEDLYREGESRGYVSMGLVPGGGVQAAYTLRF
jgi:hypothetical protein